MIVVAISALLIGQVTVTAVAAAPVNDVLAWGDGDGLGRGPRPLDDCAGIPCGRAPAPVEGLTGAVAVAAGSGHGLALRSDGTVVAWGDNGFGQLGDNTTTDRAAPVPVCIPGATGTPCARKLTGVVAVAAGRRFSLALRADGTVVAWGENFLAQLGDGTTTDRTVPVVVAGLTGVKAIAAGTSHALALGTDGTIHAWGDNSSGQLGDGTNGGPTRCFDNLTCRARPAPVRNLKGVAAIAAGAFASYAVEPGGTVRSWGRNSVGQLGDGTFTDRFSPVAVKGLTNVVAVDGGDGNHALARTAGGTVWAWGANSGGALGIGTSTGPTAKCGNPDDPIACARIAHKVEGLRDVVAMAAGRLHSVALLSDGTLRAWGFNDVAQLSTGGIDGPDKCDLAFVVPPGPLGCSVRPVTVRGATHVAAVDAGFDYTLALRRR